MLTSFYGTDVSGFRTGSKILSDTDVDISVCVSVVYRNAEPQEGLGGGRRELL